MLFFDPGLNPAGSAGWVDADATWFNVARALGSTPIALLVIDRAVVFDHWKQRLLLVAHVPAGRYDDGTQVLPHGGLAQLDQAIARLTADEYQRGWGDGLRFVEDLPTWDVLDDLVGRDFDVRGWIAARCAGWHQRMADSGQGEAVLPSWWSAAASYLGRIADPFGLEEYRYGRSARYLAGFADALRAFAHHGIRRVAADTDGDRDRHAALAAAAAGGAPQRADRVVAAGIGHHVGLSSADTARPSPSGAAPQPGPA